MPPRALIIAIEEYPVATTLATPLKGTNASAMQYFNWLTGPKQVAPDDIWLCAGSSLAISGVRRFGTTCADVFKAVVDLVATGKDTTQEFYCFISSHGFCYPTRNAMDPMDVIICSDFINPAISGAACFGLQEFQQKLCHWLGGETHYYFSDACRTQMSEDQINPGNVTLALKPAEKGVPPCSSLFSTSSGDPASVDSGFARFLCDGLRGKGHSKGWVDDNEMWVLFDLLADFVSESVPGQEVASVPGSGPRKIYKLPQIPLNSCQMTVQGAVPNDAFNAQLFLRGLPAVKQSFTGPTGTLTAPPGTYSLTVTHPTATVVQVKPPVPQGIDLFESATVLLEKVVGSPAPPSLTPGPGTTGAVLESLVLPSGALSAPGSPETTPAPPGRGSELKVDLPPNTTAVVRSLRSGTSMKFKESFSANVTPGLYRVDVIEAGRPVNSRMLRIDEGIPVIKEFRTAAPTQTHSNILNAISGALGDGRVEFSEQLGSFADWDMGLWLAILGSVRIFGPSGTFTKMIGLELETFSTMTQGTSCVYLLFGLDEVQREIRVAVGDALGKQDWQTAIAVQNIAGLFQLRLDVAPGAHFLSIDLPNSPLITVPVMCIANRVNLVTVSRGNRPADRDIVAAGNQGYLRHLRIYQHNLPLYRFVGQVPPSWQPILRNKMNLRTIRSLYIMQSQYCQRQPIANIDDPEIKKEWQDILDGKWLDPLAALVACYELYRTGQSKSAMPALQSIIDRLRQSYFSIPDTEAISVLLGLPYQRPVMPPIFLDGFLVFSNEQSWLSLQLNKIDYNSPWTEWKGAVRSDRGALLNGAPNAAGV